MRSLLEGGPNRDMGRYILGRVVQAVPVILLVSVVAFMIMALIPGDPAELLAGDQSSPEVLERIRAQLGLDRPLGVRFVDYYAHLFRGDLGQSIFFKDDVARTVLRRLPFTFTLASIAGVTAVLCGVFLGMVAAANANRRPWLDQIISVFSVAGITVSGFLLAILLILLFSVQLRWFPTGGYVPLTRDFATGLRSLVLPALTLALPNVAFLARMTRSCLLDIYQADYIATARAKGVAEWTVLTKHALRNALIPVLTIVSFIFGRLMVGAVVTETIFYLPGFGRMLLVAVQRRDYPLIQGAMLLIGITFVVINLITDMAYCYLDPRVRYN